MQQLGLELGQLLSDRLPESRLPAAVLAVNELPSGETATLPAQPFISGKTATAGQPLARWSRGNPDVEGQRT